eukprot:403347271
MVEKKQSDDINIDDSEIITTTKNNKDEGKITQKKKKKEQHLLICTTKCRYVVVKKAARQLGFKKIDDETADWDIYWCDTGGITPEQLSKMQPYQRINHYPGMYQLARKNNLCRNLMRMARIFKQDYNIFPKTWQLPSEMTDFKSQFTNKKKAKTFIVKPVHLCQGKGIFLVRKFEDVDLKQGEQYVAQRYMHKPYLIDGLKFDLRVYALVYGVDPLRVFVFQEGLARFATEEYVGPTNANLDNLFMHLTNYAINKNSENFVFNEDQDDDSSGHKRSLTAVLDHIRENEPDFDVDNLWTQIQDIIAKTMISVQPSLQHAYRSCQPEDLENSMCFEILGFDILIDEKLRPYVLEVNHCSSYGTDSPLDKKIKFDLMSDTFKLLNLSIKRKQQLKKEKAEQFNRRVLGEKGLDKFQKEQLRKQNQKERDEFDLDNLGQFKQVYPVLEDPQKAAKFDQFLEQARMIWSEFTGGVKQSGNIQPSQNAQNVKIQNNSNTNRARTDPQGVKQKAQFLQNAYHKQSQNLLQSNPAPKSQVSTNVTTASDQNKIFVKRNTTTNSNPQN